MIILSILMFWQEVHSPESGVIVKTAKDGCAEGLIYGGGGKEGIFIKEVVPESPASKSLKLKQGKPAEIRNNYSDFFSITANILNVTLIVSTEKSTIFCCIFSTLHYNHL